ncbi:MAG: GAF domain-containing protein [Bacteroidales bacterium]|nr:GAF domain-containing protein [Bacteroidales bacterium]
MKLFKNISLKNIFIVSFLLFTGLALSVTFVSLYGKYRENKIYDLEIKYNLLKINHAEITKFQDQLFIYNSDVYIKNIANYRKFDLKLTKTFILLDSILENKNIKNKIIEPVFNSLIEEYIVYEAYIDQILDINSEIFLPGVGIRYKSDYLRNNLLNNQKYLDLNLTPLVDSIDHYRTLLFNEKISKREFQKKYNFIIKNLFNVNSNDQDFYLLLFEDQLSDYYNNTLLEYTKIKTIGVNYNEGILHSLRAQNYLISDKLDELFSTIENIRSVNFKRSILNYLIIAFFVFLFNVLVFKYIYDAIYVPWKKTEPLFSQIALGQLPEIESVTTINEFSTITKKMRESIDSLNEKNSFIEHLTKGNYEAHLKLNKNDVLGNSLLKLKEELIKSDQEAVQYRETEENQKWSANGIAKIGAVMRQFTEDLNILAKNILREILEYVDAVQGVIYIHNREEGFLEQAAAISYEKSRQNITKIMPYEGLLGTILVEKRDYFYDVIPDEYIFLETGFGYAKPKSLFAFPLIFENSIYGIIEIASLEVIPEYKRQFLLTLANEIAITISYTEINVRTKQLFEQSKIQADELKSNEKLFKKNQDNLKSLLRMTEEHLNETLHSLKLKEKLAKEKIQQLLTLEKEINTKEEYIENITNEYENIKSSLENQNSELRKRVEELENRIRNKK